MIDEIKRWRDSLGKTDEKPIFYTDNQENYLLTILNDNRFIGASPLTQSVTFADKNDPFLLVPLKKAEGKEANPVLSALELKESLAHYQKYMEYLATERAYELSQMPAQKHPRTYKNPPV